MVKDRQVYVLLITHQQILFSIVVMARSDTIIVEFYQIRVNLSKRAIQYQQKDFNQYRKVIKCDN